MFQSLEYDNKAKLEKDLLILTEIESSSEHESKKEDSTSFTLSLYILLFISINWLLYYYNIS